MTPAEKGPDSESLVAEVERLGDAFRKCALAGADLVAACTRLEALASHDDRKVRYAVVHAALHATDECFAAIVPRLTKDRNTWVANAAKGGVKARSARKRDLLALDDQAATIAALEKEIAAADGKAALRRARKLADAREELLAQKLRHEVKKVAAGFRFGLADLDAEARAPSPDAARLHAHADRLMSTGRLLLSIVTTASDVKDELPPRYERHGVRAMVEEALRLLHDRADRPERIAATVAIDDALGVDADRGRILQAFSNILENAVEAHADGAPVAIHVTAVAASEGTEVCIAFRDEGRGIRAEDLPLLFVPFGSTKKGARGLGLCNVKKMIASAHGGDVHIESARGVGTTVHVVLPVEQKACP